MPEDYSNSGRVGTREREEDILTMTEPGGIEKLLQEAKYALLDTRRERGILQEISTLGGEFRAQWEKENAAVQGKSLELAGGMKALKEGLEKTRISSAELREEKAVLDQERQTGAQELEEARKRRKILKTNLSDLRTQGTELEQCYQENVCERERAHLKDAWVRYQMYTAVTGIRWDEEADGQRGYISLEKLEHFDLKKGDEEGITAASGESQAVRAADYLWRKIEEAAQVH